LGFAPNCFGWLRGRGKKETSKSQRKRELKRRNSKRETRISSFIQDRRADLARQIPNLAIL
jgi:hypothetical protein